jgi:hypothetical protein
MTPPAAAVAPRTRTKRHAPPPRRVSGPARGRAAATTVAAPPPLALRLGGAVHGLAEHHLLERIVRGRAWIAILGVGLIGIVFMQVSMLRMNAGIGQAIERAGTLERENAAIRASISELSSGDRIAAEASKLGLILPPGTARFLDARGADARRALASMTAPGQGIVPSVTSLAPAAISTVPTLADTSVAPTTATSTATMAPDGTAPVTPSPTTTAPTTAAATATATPPAAQTQTQASPAASQQTAQPAAAPASTGGADATGQAG